MEHCVRLTPRPPRTTAAAEPWPRPGRPARRRTCSGCRPAFPRTSTRLARPRTTAGFPLSCPRRAGRLTHAPVRIYLRAQRSLLSRRQSTVQTSFTRPSRKNVAQAASALGIDENRQHRPQADHDGTTTVCIRQSYDFGRLIIPLPSEERRMNFD